MKIFTKKLLILLVILILFITPLYSPSSGDYNIGDVSKDITINNDGSVDISEDIHYQISGEINGVYRNVTLSGNQSITNISVDTPGYYNTLEVINDTHATQLRVWLYTDEAKTQRVSSGDVEVVYNYTFLDGVKVYNDVAEFQYNLWDDSWNKGVDSLVANIKLPGSNSSVEYWSNPDLNLNSSTWVDSQDLELKYDSLTSSQSQEVRILMPTDYFTSTRYADVINTDAKATIEEQQQDYQQSQDLRKDAINIASVVMVILMVLPAGVYYRYGRDPKIDYDLEYETAIPTEHSPVFINQVLKGDVGDIDMDGFNAVFLDLINKGFYKILHYDEDDIVLRQTSKDTSGLEQYQQDVIEFLDNFRQDGKISLKYMKERGDEAMFERFLEFWKIDVNRHVKLGEIGKLFDNRGVQLSNLVVTVSVLFSVLAVVVLLLFFNGFDTRIPIILAVILLVESIVIYFRSNTFMGRWTKDGKLLNARWNAFKNYLSDYSLIKEYPPESVQIWGDYLVYATALGCADKTSKNMKKYFKESGIPESSFLASEVMIFTFYGGLTMMHVSFVSSMYDNVDPGSFGNIGGPGSGGFGGGGGGVF